LTWRIDLTASAVQQLGKLDKSEARRITNFLRQRIATLDNPRTLGKPLTGPQLGEFWRYRVGDYRIICDVQDHPLVVLVIEIGNHRDIYR
jgi:mRNA interferase RelE/StbE